MSSKKMYLNEVEQDVNIKFAWCKREDDNITTCHPFVKCRDYLHDVIWYVKYNKHCSEDIHGFTYDPHTCPPITADPYIYMAIRSTNSKVIDSMKISKRVLNLFEKENDLPLSRLYTTTKENILLFKSPKDWIDSLYSTSLYSYLIRVGAQISDFSTKEEFLQKLRFETKGNDSGYAQTVHKHLFNIFKYRKEVGFNKHDFSSWGSYTVHDSGGICAFCNLYISDHQKDLKQTIRKILAEGK